MHIALAPFKLKHGVAEETLLNTSEEFEHLFVQKQDGILRRILVRDSDGGYADIVFFEDEKAIERVLDAEQHSDVCAAFFSIIGRRGLTPRIRGPQDLRVMARRRDLQLLRLAVIAIAIATNVEADIRSLHPGHPAVHGPVHYLTALDGLLLSLIDPTSWRASRGGRARGPGSRPLGRNFRGSQQDHFSTA